MLVLWESLKLSSYPPKFLLMELPFLLAGSFDDIYLLDLSCALGKNVNSEFIFILQKNSSEKKNCISFEIYKMVMIN